MTSVDDSRRERALVPNLVFVAALVAVVSSLGAPLIPTIARADHVSVSTGQWLLTAALLTGALATPVMGRLADGPRQRTVVVATLSVVLAGCVLAAVADDFALSVLGRALQGVGLGLLPVTMAVARTNLAPERAGRAIATLSVTAAIGVGLGYPITGLIAQAFGFHAAYWFGAIVVAVALVASLVVLPPRNPARVRPFDAVGAVLLSVVVIALSVVLSEGGGWGWTSGRSLGLIAITVVVLAAWIPFELRHADPLVQLRQVRNRSVLTADVSGFLMCVGMYLFLPILVEFVQIPMANGFGFGASVVASGLVLLPLSAGSFVASRFLVAYERRFGTRTMIPLGSLLFALATSFFATHHTAMWQAFVASGVAGLGIGFTFAAMPGFIVRAVPASETGSATGFYQVLRNVGLSLGSALSAAILTAHTHDGHLYPAVGGFTTALLAAAGLGITTAVLSFVLPGRSASAGAPLTDTRQHEVDVAGEEEAELAGAGVMLADDDLMVEPEVPAT
jgi:MFS family permease